MIHIHFSWRYRLLHTCWGHGLLCGVALTAQPWERSAQAIAVLGVGKGFTPLPVVRYKTDHSQ